MPLARSLPFSSLRIPSPVVISYTSPSLSPLAYLPSFPSSYPPTLALSQVTYVLLAPLGPLGVVIPLV
jgi:hypothetical protein